MQRQIRVDFRHGIGDCSHFAHMIPLYLRRDYPIKVCCVTERMPFFKAAGAEVSADRAPEMVLWLHPPVIKEDHLFHPAKYNKAALNLNMYPLPFIGQPEDIWDEYVANEVSILPFIEPADWQMVRHFTDALPRPLILLHTIGYSLRESKSLSPEFTLELYEQLLESCDGTLLILDWENLSPKHPSPRVLHLTDDWSPLGVRELAALLAVADLLVGVDSGPLHFARMTNTPALGICLHPRHHPFRFCLPKASQAYVIPGGDLPILNDLARGSFNLIEEPQPTAQDIVRHAMRMLAGPRFVRGNLPGLDAFLQSWVIDRFQSAVWDRLFTEMARRFQKPSIVEIGYFRPPNSPHHQAISSTLFATMAHHGAASFHSIQRQADHLHFAQSSSRFLHHATLVKAHPLDELQRNRDAIDVLCLAAPTAASAYHTTVLEELATAFPRLRPPSLIVLDETAANTGVPWLQERGWKVLETGNHMLLSFQ